MSRLILRLLVLVAVLLCVYLFEAFPILYKGLLKQGELGAAEAVKVFLGQSPFPSRVDLFRVHGKLTSVEERFVYEDNSRRVLIHLDKDGNPTEDETEAKAFKVAPTNPALEVWKTSYIQRFYLHWIGLAVIILMLIKELVSDLLERTAPAREQKRKLKVAKGAVEQALKLREAKQWQKIVDKFGRPEDRSFLPPQDLEAVDIALAIAYLKLDQADKGLPLAAKCKGKDGAGELALEIGSYYARNPGKARFQDLIYLCAYIEANPHDSQFAKFFADFCLRHKVSDARSIPLLIQHFESATAVAEVRTYLLEHLSKLTSMTPEAIKFFEICKLQDKENPLPLLILARHKTEANQYKEALDDLETLLNLDYENQEIHEMLYVLHKKNRKLPDLFQLYSNVLEQVPEESIALTQQRKIKDDPDFDQSSVSRFDQMSLQELFSRKQTCDDPATLAEIDASIEKRKKFLTVMFTDIKGYTKLSEKYPNDMMRVVIQSDQILPPIIQKHEGTVIKKIGDAYMARFDTADAALTAAMQIQQLIVENNRRRQEKGVFAWEIRIGMNTGFMYYQDGDVFGDEVNVASRVESSGEPNQVFCTEGTVQAVNNKKIQFEYRGEKEVKGKSAPIKLYSLVFDPNGLDARLSESVFQNEIFNT